MFAKILLFNSLVIAVFLVALPANALTNNTVAPVVSQTTYEWSITATDDTTYCSGGSPALTRFVIVTEDTDSFTFTEHASVDFSSLPATLSFTPNFGEDWENIKLGCAAPDIYDRYSDFSNGAKYFNYSVPNADDRPGYVVTAFSSPTPTSSTSSLAVGEFEYNWPLFYLIYLFQVGWPILAFFVVVRVMSKLWAPNK